MGVDVNLYAEGEVNDEQFDAAVEYLDERVGYLCWREGAPIIERDKWEPQRITFETMERYYGPGYERGRWPDIYGAIMAMRTALPTCKVFYGDDTVDHAPEATDEYLASIWAHWLGPRGNDYRRAAAEQNRRLRAPSSGRTEDQQRAETSDQ